MREKEIEFLQMGKGEHHVLAHFFGLKWKYPQESYIPFRTVEAPHRFFVLTIHVILGKLCYWRKRGEYG